jgi:O-acetyl-ADP-ribose deacetylase (regulator of RNase III)
VYRYPIFEAAKIAVQTTNQFTSTHPSIETVYFIAFGNDIQQAYQIALAT